MANEIWHDLQYMVLGRDDPELFVPQAAYARVVAGNRLSVIGRPLNTHAQHLRRFMRALPRSWGLATRVHARILDDRRIQFRFQSAVDLASVMLRGPWLFNHWFVALQRWEDFPRPDFLTFIDLWVQVRGIPVLYLSTMTVRFIASTLGPVMGLDFDEETTTQVEFIRVKIRLSITDRLRFFRRVCFESRERAMIGFEYERLRRICSNCCRITHDLDHCPYLAHQVNPDNGDDDEADVLAVPVWEEGAGSNNPSPPPPEKESSSSDISSDSPISQPPNPTSPALDLNMLVSEHQAHLCNHTHGKHASDDPSTSSDRKDKGKFEHGESSKRKKDKQVEVTTKRSMRRCRSAHGVRFYSSPSQPPYLTGFGILRV
ncbi:hypothetical protein AXX17_AT2G09650 [Arabidopsis thaliana]|uniref:DUF4283 domain-containing protein n=1 Tax=Arabidopsis thaliana TaxID=3702 RepID=A0A178VX56_ARATH|nr:hypothetical protein AXX17_AT2G09650 [Arabidopsis thaliana]